MGMSKQERIEMFKKVVDQIKRDGLEALTEYLLNRTDYFTAPASASYHSAYEGGLFDHSMNVMNKLIKLNRANDLGLSLESIAIIGLFHDICKINCYKVEYRNAKNEKGLWVKVPYYKFIDDEPIGVHGDKSVSIIQRFMKLTTEEIYCIRYHMGAFEGEKSIPSLSAAIRKCPTILWVQLADQLATLKEEEEDANSNKK